MSTHLKNLSDYHPETVPTGKGYQFSLIVSEWNDSITNALLEGAYSVLIDHEVDPLHIQVRRVPGSFELPLGGQWALENTNTDAVILLGCVIQGETRHFDFICQAVSQGAMNLGLKFSKPVVFGVLTTENIDQALDRAGGKHGNKGVEAAVTALKMLALK